MSGLLPAYKDAGPDISIGYDRFASRSRSSDAGASHQLKNASPRRSRLSILRFLKVIVACLATVYVLGPSLMYVRDAMDGFVDKGREFSRIITHDPNSPTDRLNFTPCFPNPAKDTNQHKWKCGYLDVPLDYTNHSDSRTARIALVMYQAGKTKSNRTIVLNPGGPGGSGSGTAWYLGEQHSHDFSNGTMDILGFDPRGVNMSTPNAACHKHDVFRDRWSTLARQFTDTSANGDRNLSVGENHLRVTDIYFQAMWKACEEKNGDLGRFLTTAFVARDVDAIRDALGEDEITAIVYSYGTNLMQTYSAMFPHRVGRVVLDGVQYSRLTRSPFDWGRSTNGNGTASFYKGFLTECIKAGPETCELAKINGTVQTLDSVKDHIHDLLASLRVLPRPATHPEQGAGLVTYESVVSNIFSSTYSPGSWTKVAKMLKQLLEGNNTLALESHTWEYDPLEQQPQRDGKGEVEWKGVKAPESTSSELVYQVICGDSYDAPKEPWSSWMAYYHDARIRSWLWPGNFFPIIFSCRTYQNSYGPPAEVYRGNYTSKLKNPLLLIAGTFDPVTPIPNARMVQKEWGTENTRLVIHHGYGHTSFKDPSECTNEIIRDVILSGKWPGEGEERECMADRKPFDAKKKEKADGKKDGEEDEKKEGGNDSSVLDKIVPWLPLRRK
ncbi:unnamed protein product [Tilletia controversa]|uniref:AB hydrolase-1 domain-containing protein n=3 Tax=Tilletia TaxID=13289 RepID=A0A8X7SVN7_9BASI|nr:hypothetical protein CF336_g3811 [Tilletia laevis]KAE8194154.1 hypothetical protein CF328_g4839 [Tilletia controversa]KAE8261579.1 hypothetical protein A4X03_0g3131 [Tilletia caries]KAE8203472.1 hypothetical protein CF335_g3005 [Tilletia laevis]KAE8245517.1 hypothetical protein A4X06_0g5640 [Tilletia controversa]